MKKLFFWLPRILIILFALFLAIFSLDIFDGNYGFWGTILGLFMHNIPSLILVIILIISWRRDLVGAIIFFILGIACIIGFFINLGKVNPILIIGSIVFILIGILFYKNKK